MQKLAEQALELGIALILLGPLVLLFLSFFQRMHLMGA